MSVAPGFLEGIGVRLVSGRQLDEGDREGAPEVVVINETMARTFWPAGDALGARVQIGSGAPSNDWITVVGIIADVRQHGPTQAVRPHAFGTTWQYSFPRRNFVLRTDALPASLMTDVRAAVRRIDPALAVGTIQPFDQLVSDRTARHRLVMLALTGFGVVALVLSAFGLYAVVALTSQLRRREYAIRLALGARTGRSETTRARAGPATGRRRSDCRHCVGRGRHPRGAGHAPWRRTAGPCDLCVGGRRRARGCCGICDAPCRSSRSRRSCGDIEGRVSSPLSSGQAAKISVSLSWGQADV